jgi:large subunit ribosomal protein L13
MERETYKIDGTGKSLGRLASEIAIILRGKDKPQFYPHKDDGAIVVLENSDKIKATGKKKNQKQYYRHSGYLGGIKKESMESLDLRRPGETIRRAVMGMLPKNKLRSKMIKRLKIK